MKNLAAIQERYLRDPLPIRLGGLAANLARIESFSNHDALRDAVESLLNESKHFIEWTAADADLAVQVDLVEIQRQLAKWHLAKAEIWLDSGSRAHLAQQAGQLSKLILERSGLLR